MTQTERLVRFNVTGRVSDARAQGYVIECERRFDGRQSYRLIDEPVQQAMFG